MPSVTQEQSFVPSKKRRRDDNDGEIRLPLYAHFHPRLSNRWADDLQNSAQDIEPSQNIYAVSLDDPHHNNFAFRQRQHEQQHDSREHFSGDHPLARKIIPLPTAKRARLYDEELENGSRQGLAESRGQQRQQSAPSSPRHTKSPSKELQQTSGNSRPAAARTTSSALLSPCHICHRKPTKRSDLDSYADCMGCGQRTCYVCIRECLGWKVPEREDDEMPSQLEENLSASFHMEDAPNENETGPESGNADQKEQKIADWATGGRGHRPMVCSRCCIERPTDGEIICFGCLPFVEA